MGNTCSDTYVPNQLAMRCAGVFCVVLSIIEAGIAGSVYNFFTNFRPGNWWGVILVFVAGVFGIASSNRGILITGCVISAIATIVCIIATVLEGLTSSYVNQAETCSYSPYDSVHNTFDAPTYYGNLNYPQVPNMNLCLTAEDFGIAQSNCACIGLTTSLNVYSCAGPFFMSSPTTNCGQILTSYASLLRASTAFLAISCIAVFTYSVLTCTSLCCSPPSPQPVNPPTAYVTQATPQPFVVQTQGQAPPQVFIVQSEPAQNPQHVKY